MWTQLLYHKFAITLTRKTVSDGKKKVMGQFESDSSLITIAHVIKLWQIR